MKLSIWVALARTVVRFGVWLGLVATCLALVWLMEWLPSEREDAIWHQVRLYDAKRNAFYATRQARHQHEQAGFANIYLAERPCEPPRRIDDSGGVFTDESFVRSQAWKEVLDGVLPWWAFEPLCGPQGDDCWWMLHLIDFLTRWVFPCVTFFHWCVFLIRLWRFCPLSHDCACVRAEWHVYQSTMVLSRPGGGGGSPAVRSPASTREVVEDEWDSDFEPVAPATAGRLDGSHRRFAASHARTKTA